eukprot:scaffold177016_cov21-Tisochrysis_lutea.AAC.1
MVPYCMSGNMTGYTSHSPTRTSVLHLRRGLTDFLCTLMLVPQSKVGGVYGFCWQRDPFPMQSTLFAKEKNKTAQAPKAACIRQK